MTSTGPGGFTSDDFMMPKSGKRSAGSRAVTEIGMASVSQYTAMTSSVNAHSATYKKSVEIAGVLSIFNEAIKFSEMVLKHKCIISRFFWTVGQNI